MPSQELGAGAGTGFPNFIDTIQVFQNLPTVISDGPARFDAEVINDLLDAVLAIQTAAGADPVGSTNIQLTNAQVLALATGAGVELLAAPGANKAIIVTAIHIVSDASAGAWVEPSAPDDLVLRYAGGAVITGVIEATVLVAASVNVRKYGVLDTELVPEANAGVNLFNPNNNWTGGNAANTLSIRVFHSTVSTIAFT